MSYQGSSEPVHQWAGQEGFRTRDVGTLVHVSKEQSVAGLTEQHAGHLQMRKRETSEQFCCFLFFFECHLWFLILQRQLRKVRCNGRVLLVSAASSQMWLCIWEVGEKELKNWFGCEISPTSSEFPTGQLRTWWIIKHRGCIEGTRAEETSALPHTALFGILPAP